MGGNMENQIQETATNVATTVDYNKTLKAQQGQWTLETLGEGLSIEPVEFQSCKNQKELAIEQG
jgi:hypothetical protein